MKFRFSDWFGGGGGAPRIVFPPTDGPTFRAVGVRPGKDCCQGAVQMSDLRFLVGKAPKLPLPGCDAASCDCRYAHYSDRRREIDRRRTVASEGEAVVPFDRRQSNGRRSTDALI